MDREDSRKVSTLLVKLETIRKSLKKNKMDEGWLRAFTPKKLKHIRDLLKDFEELKAIGIDNDIIRYIVSVLAEIELLWGKAEGSEKENIIKKYSVPENGKTLNRYIDQVIMQLTFIASRQEHVIKLICASTFDEVMKEFGSRDNFLNSLKYYVINRPGDKRFRKFYDLYSSIFTLPEERESFEGFETVFKFVKDKKFFDEFGRWEETCICCEDPKTGVVLGAVNFSVYQMPREIVKKFGVDATNHIVYVFVRRNYRTLGLGQVLLKMCYDYSQKWAGGLGKKVVYFCEQNNPKLMTIKEYLTDNKNAGIDQCDRLVWWKKRNFKKLDFSYVQLPLCKGANPCVNLSFNVRVDGFSDVPSAIVLEHLKRFFKISVLKGNDISKDRYFVMQQDFLIKNPKVRCLDEDVVSLKAGVGKMLSSVVLDSKKKNAQLAKILK